MGNSANTTQSKIDNKIIIKPNSVINNTNEINKRLNNQSISNIE